jgi:flagella basal body P-ring formation protein FlgA
MRALLLMVLWPALARAGVADEVALRIRATLPAELALVGLTLPPGLPERPERLWITWTVAPRPGSCALEVRAGHKRGFAHARLLPIRRVLTALRALADGEAIGAEDVALAAVPVEEGRGFAGEPRALAGARALRPIAAGAVIGEEDVMRPAPVRRGARVRVLVTNGALTVATSGVLERDARPGDAAPVRLASHRLVTGRIVDEATVALEGGAP